MSEYDTHEADEVPVEVEARAEEFRAAMPATLRDAVLENLVDLLDAIAPGRDSDDRYEGAWELAVAEFRADLLQNPHAFDRADFAGGLVPPSATDGGPNFDHFGTAREILAAVPYPPTSREALGMLAVAQVHATLANVPSADGAWPR